MSPVPYRPKVYILFAVDIEPDGELRIGIGRVYANRAEALAQIASLERQGRLWQIAERELHGEFPGLVTTKTGLVSQ